MDAVTHIGEVMADSLIAHKLIAPSSLARIEFDGACEPRNPGGVATGGYRILIGDTVVRECGEYYCAGNGATNNVAEYAALGRALAGFAGSIHFALKLGVKELKIVGDSQLVIYQVRDEWGCNKHHLSRLRDRCRELIRQIELAGIAVTLERIPRKQNVAADALSRQAYEKHTGKKFPERRQRRG